MREETDPRVTAYFNCLGSATRAEERREELRQTPSAHAPPAITSSEWVECVTRAIERTANEYGCNGDHDSDLIADALNRLSLNLRAEIETHSTDSR